MRCTYLWQNRTVNWCSQLYLSYSTIRTKSLYLSVWTEFLLYFYEMYIPMAVLVWVNNRPPGPVEWRPKRLEVGADNFSLVRAKMTRYVDMLRVGQLSVGTCISTRVFILFFRKFLFMLKHKRLSFFHSNSHLIVLLQ
jgi:hypothetical protein